METKICKGISHPEGVELPINSFERRLDKSINSYRNICHKCRYRQRHPKRERKIGSGRKKYLTDIERIEHSILSRLKWLRTEKGVAYSRRRALNRYYKNKNKFIEYSRVLDKKNRDNLSYKYVKELWIDRNNNPNDFNNEIWLFEYIRLMAYRELKKQKKIIL